MDRLAIISDIHGNITALNAVLDDIASREISRIICLGDYVTKGCNPDLVIDKIREKSVNKLIEYPKISRKKNVPIMETGTAIAGINVDLKSCKKIKTTTNTNKNASIKVVFTLSIDAVKNLLVS